VIAPPTSSVGVARVSRAFFRVASLAPRRTTRGRAVNARSIPSLQQPAQALRAALRLQAATLPRVAGRRHIRNDRSIRPGRLRGSGRR
jgi:hypothetical protein